MLERRNIPQTPSDAIMRVTGSVGSRDYLLHTNYDINPIWEPEDEILGHVVVRSYNELLANSSSSVGDSIYLKPNIIYQIFGHINIGSKTIYPNINTRLEGRYASLDQLVGNTTNSVVYYNNNNTSTTLRNITIYNSNSLGTACTFEGTNANLATQYALFTGYKGLVTNNCNSIVCENFVATVPHVSGSGFVFNNTMSTVLLSVGSIINTVSSSNSILFNSGSNVSTITIEKNTFFLGNSTTNGINVVTGSSLTIGRLLQNSFRNTSGGIPTYGFTHETPQWIFSANFSSVSTNSIKDSDIHCASNFYNTTAVIHNVSSSGLFQPIQDPDMTIYLSERIEQLTGSKKNYFRYTGTLPRDMNISSNLTCNMTAPGDVRLGFGFMKNGELLSGSVQLMGANKGTYGAPPITITTNLDMVYGDEIVPVIANLTDTTDIEIYSLQFCVEGDY